MRHALIQPGLILPDSGLFLPRRRPWWNQPNRFMVQRRCCCDRPSCPHCSGTVPGHLDVLFDNITNSSCTDCADLMNGGNPYSCTFVSGDAGACYWRYLFGGGASCSAASVWVRLTLLFLEVYMLTGVGFGSGVVVDYALSGYPGDCQTWSSVGLIFLGSGQCSDDDPTNPHCFVTAS